MNFLSRKNPGENILVIDISSGSTAAAFAHTKVGSLPEIIAQVRTPFTGGKNQGDAMLASLHTSLTAIAGKVPLLVERGFSGSVDKAVVAFSSPWITSDLKTVIIEREQSFILDKSSIKDVMLEEKELLLSRLAEGSKQEVNVFESALTSLYLNGYESPGPVDHKIKKAEVSFILSAIDKKLLYTIENEIIKSVGIKRGAAFHSFMYIYFKVLSQAFQSLHSALLINMTHETTDVLFIRHGNAGLKATLSFGPSVIGRAIAARLGVPQEIAHSYLSLFAMGAFDRETTESIDKALTDVEERWKTEWRSMGESIPEGKDVPYSIFLVVPEGFQRLMKTFLESVFQERRMVIIGDTNTFTKELVSASSSGKKDEKITILSSFSNMLK